jgi:hypothetical protein
MQHKWESGTPLSTLVEYRAKVSGWDGDLAWYQVTDPAHTVGDYFYANTSTIYSVSQVLRPVPGDDIWKFGRKAGRHGIEVKHLNWCVDYDGSGGYPEFCDMIASTRPVYGENGDSGGPWYLGGTAMAVHSGAWNSWGAGYWVGSAVEGNLAS